MNYNLTDAELEELISDGSTKLSMSHNRPGDHRSRIIVGPKTLGALQELLERRKMVGREKPQ